MLGYGVKDGRYLILVNDPMNFYGIEDIRQIVGMDLQISLCEEAPLTSAIQYYYSEVSARKAAVKASQNSTEEENIVDINVEEGDDDTPIINLLNSIILRAYNSGVSDIHIEPFEHQTTVRMRVEDLAHGGPRNAPFPEKRRKRGVDSTLDGGVDQKTARASFHEEHRRPESGDEPRMFESPDPDHVT